MPPESRRAYLILLLFLGTLCWFVCCQQMRQTVTPPRPTPPTPTPTPSGQLARLVLSCVDKTTEQPLPTRFTLVNAALGPGLFKLTRPRKDVAARPRQGLLYTLGQPVTLLLRPGRYTIYATRGMAWSMAKQRLQLDAGEPQRLTLRLTKEIDTRGYSAIDTHIHTKTYSGHGDINVAERAVSIAGEGLDLAIATDHNANVDYRQAQRETGTSTMFRSIIGNEVGSLHDGRYGHINIFPVTTDSHVPNSEFKSWRSLIRDIQQTNASFWILNHPRWPQEQGLPAGSFKLFGFNRVSGAFRRNALPFPFQGIELINADTALTRKGKMPLYLFRDWFALLNSGVRVPGVAGSDSHTVKVPVGQARTYVRHPKGVASLNDKQLIAALRKGRSGMSMGLFVTMTMTGMPDKGPGSTISVAGQRHVQVNVRVQAAGWIRPRRLMIFLNGQLASNTTIQSAEGVPTDQRQRITLATPPNDAHLVAIALGDGVSHPPRWSGELMQLERYTVGATNPIFLDVDGDKRYTSARELARLRLRQWGTAPKALWPRLYKSPPVLGIQLMHLLRRKWASQPEKMAIWHRWLRRLGARHRLYQNYRRSLLRPAPAP